MDLKIPRNVLVSVIIPTSAEHHALIPRAIKSVDFPRAEIIVVNDSNKPLLIAGPTVLNRPADQAGPLGAGAARNIGVRASAGECLLFLDADDYLLPGAIAALWEAYLRSYDKEDKRGSIVYGSLRKEMSDGRSELFTPAEQYCGPDLTKTCLVNPVRPYCSLVPRAAHDNIGGFDESMETWEDVDYERRLDAAGWCAVRIPQVIYAYVWDTGLRRNAADNQLIRARAQEIMYNKLKPYYRGEIPMGCSGCGKNKNPVRSVRVQQNTLPIVDADEHIVFKISHPNMQSSVRTYLGPATGKHYRLGGNLSRNTQIVVGLGEGEMDPADAEAFVGMRIAGYNLFSVYVEKEEEPFEVLPTAPALPKAKPVVQEIILKPQPDDEPIELATVAPIEGFTVAEVRNYLAEGVNLDVAKAWLEQEQAGKNRVTAVKALIDHIHTHEAAVAAA